MSSVSRPQSAQAVTRANPDNRDRLVLAQARADRTFDRYRGHRRSAGARTVDRGVRHPQTGGVRWTVAGGLFVVTLASRLPFATEHFWAHDSVLYARAMADFDPASHQPQAPGYLYYVALLRALDVVIGDPNRTMTLISALAAAAAVALLYAFAARLYDETVGRSAALLLLTSASFWGYGAVAYPYTLLAALTVACAWLFWRVLAAARARTGRLVVAAAAWGIASGFRLDLLLFLAPLWVIAAASAGKGPAAASAAIVCLLIAAWLALTALAVGGLDEFLSASRAQAQAVSDRHGVLRNGLPALRDNAYDLARFLSRALYATALPLAAVLLWSPARRLLRTDGRRLGFVMLWAATPLPVYLLLHVGDLGYVFSLLPALCVLAARAFAACAGALRRPAFARWTLAGAVACNALLFLFADLPASATELERRDRGVADKLAYIDRLALRREVIVVAGADRVIAEHYIGGRLRVLGFAPEEGETGLAELSCAARPCLRRVTVVLWDESTRVRGDEWRVRRLKHGARLRVADVTHTRELRVTPRGAIALDAPLPAR